ncbi:MAG: isochorismatase family protein [Candidatus Aminicenantes bacterium]|nr:isochorismatase family protein [Candidatus Aminicenantes bacterium]NIM83782.1 isochorismatase family protein [Candidatus Aminicenantes bacterium]NIN23242.1 isochorismatase family protein [Candidatus Aminicenantes bacterium]NIN46936.1 isochorismatase family protein [Candidatus Aminicenantes bacterium]NIN89858.1 isochorismatase family protein [Candidatus Aminicenantes bacterium]
MNSDYLKEIERYNIRRGEIRPQKCALLVIDMQNYFDSISRNIQQNLLKIIDTCRANGMRIVFTRHGHKDISKDGGMLAKWWGDCIMYGTPDWQLMPEFTPGEEDLLIDKNRYSAFFNTGLDEKLQAEGIEELIITGVMTNCCCETTAREGFVRDYRIFFVADATATANDDLHLSTLKTLAYGFAHIVSTEEVCKQIRV